MSELSKNKTENEGSRSTLSEANASIVHQEMNGAGLTGKSELATSQTNAYPNEDGISQTINRSNNSQKQVSQQSKLLTMTSLNISLDLNKKPTKDASNTKNGIKGTGEEESDKGNSYLGLYSYLSS